MVWHSLSPRSREELPRIHSFFFSRYCIRQPIRHTLCFRSLWTTFELIYNLIPPVFPRNLLSKAMSLSGLGFLSKLDVAFILLPQKAKRKFFFFLSSCDFFHLQTGFSTHWWSLKSLGSISVMLTARKKSSQGKNLIDSLHSWVFLAKATAEYICC